MDRETTAKVQAHAVAAALVGGRVPSGRDIATCLLGKSTPRGGREMDLARRPMHALWFASRPGTEGFPKMCQVVNPKHMLPLKGRFARFLDIR